MIQTLPCPSCHRVLVLTTETSLQAVLRCRHCSHQFVLGEMVEAELGFWEVVDDPNAPEPKVASAGGVVTEDGDVEEAKPEEYISPQMVIQAQAEKKKTDFSGIEPIIHEQYERTRRKAKSPMRSVLSVMLGGLASIPIATLLIWHVLGKDPLQMGPAVARYAPWIVPTRFQPHRFAEDVLPAAPAAGASGFRRFDNVMNSSEQTGGPPAPEPSAGEAYSETSTTAPSIPSRTGFRPSFRAMSTPSALAAGNLANDESIADNPPATADSSKDVFSIINQVEKNLESWNEHGEDREVLKKLAVSTYSNLAALALAMNQLPPSPIRRLVRTELQSVGQEVAKHVDIQKMIQGGSRFWLAKNHNEDLVGLAIVIEIDRIVEVDKAWQITPTTAVGEESISFTVPKEIFPSLSEGQSILAIGCVSRAKAAENAEASDLSTKLAATFTASYIYALKP